MRAFIALDLPQEIKTEAEALQIELKSRDLFKGLYVDPKLLHLTLAFLGHQTPQQIENVRAKLRTVTPKPMLLRLGQLGVFSPHKIRVVYVELLCDQLKFLHQKIIQALDHTSDKPFRGHITLARVTSIYHKQQLLATRETIHTQANTRYLAESFSLYHSTLTPQGPIYKPIERFMIPRE